MDLSSTGKIEKADHPLVIMNILFDYKLTDTLSGNSIKELRLRGK